MMSLFAALTVAVGGLASQSSAIGNISDNLSNAQTTGFKGINTNFESLVTQSNALSNDPGGVRATPHYTNDIQGNLVQSQSATALAISGQGFFQVRPAIVSATGDSTFSGVKYYTRVGDFALNNKGYLVNSAGYYLTGSSIDSAGISDDNPQPILISALMAKPVPTSTVDFAANLPASVDSTLAVPFTSSPSTIQVYDTLGTQHDLSITWTKAASDANHEAALLSISNDITLQSKFSGQYGNGIKLKLSDDLAVGHAGEYVATISATGQADETFSHISTTGGFWTNLANALNTGDGIRGASRLVDAQAGAGTDAPNTTTTYTLSGGTGASTNGNASVATNANGLTLTALDSGIAGNHIQLAIAADGAVPGNMIATLTNTTTGVSEVYASMVGDATFWNTLRDAINATPSAFVMATNIGTHNALPVVTGGTPIQLTGGTDPLPTTNAWYMNITVPGGGGLDALTNAPVDYTATIPVGFNSVTVGTTMAGTLETLTPSTGIGAQGSYTCTAAGLAQITLPLDFTGSGATGTQDVTVNLGTFNSTSNGVTQFADTAVSVGTFDQNGIPKGSFQDLSIDKNGFIALNYDNGLTKTYFQIPIFLFNAQDQLQRVTGGAFAETLTSGSASPNVPGKNGAGTIVGNSLESSNVDIAEEFTKLIQAQQIYSANAKTITTADNMMQEVINIIR